MPACLHTCLTGVDLRAWKLGWPSNAQDAGLLLPTGAEQQGAEALPAWAEHDGKSSTMCCWRFLASPEAAERAMPAALTSV